MSGLLEGLGLQPDGEATPAPAAEPAVEIPPAVPVTPDVPPAAEPTVPPEPEDEIVVPEGAENPDAVRNLIASERAAARAAYKRAREAEAQLAALTEASMPVEERLAAVTQRAEAAELRAQRLSVGMKHGLSPTLSEMLQGNDEQSLEQSAQAVLAELESRRTATATVPGLSLNGGPTPLPAKPSDPAQDHNNFLAEAIRRHRTGA